MGGYILNCALLVVLVVTATRGDGRSYRYLEKYLEVPLDHFSYTTSRTFQMRYLINNSYAENNPRSPILIYPGNEGDIELFAEHTGFIWDLAPILKASVVFAEHRFYGKSLPFSKVAYHNRDQAGYLTPEQALEDYAYLLDHLTSGRHDRPVIAIGGSYGAILAAWFRMKYPHIVTGALSSSGPILQFSGVGQTRCDEFSLLITNVFRTAYNENCSKNIKRSWDTLEQFAFTEDGRKYLNSKFKFCNRIEQPQSIYNFLNYIETVFAAMGMANYPYATDFLAPMPAYPIKAFCSELSEEYYENNLVDGIQRALSVYTNYTGKTECLDYNSAFGSSLDTNAWWFQTCSMMVMPSCTGGPDSMYRDRPWIFEVYANDCQQRFNVRPDPKQVIIKYGGDNLMYASNIIFSNGMLDPWSVGGVLKTTNSRINIVNIPDSAHHIDLRSAHPDDPKVVRDAREEEIRIMKAWIKEYYQHRY